MGKISVIVPVYKVESYIHCCIDSILAQSYSDFELILVDDGSPDNCGAICDEYAERDSRICVIHKQNGGLSSARNAGLDVATGKYVCFIDSDDIADPSLLETVIPYMEKGYDLTAFCFQGFYDDGTILQFLPRKKSTWILENEEKRKAFIHKKLLQGAIGWEAWSRVFVREIIENYHLRFEDNREIFAEDMFFSLCYCAHAKQIMNLDTVLYHYRQRKDSIMRQETGRNNMGRIQKLVQAVLDHYRTCDDCTLLVEDFQFLHFQIIMNQFISQISNVSDYASFRDEIRAKTSDWDQIRGMIQKQLSDKGKLITYYPPLRYFELTRNASFLLGGSPVVLKISNWFVLKIRNQKERVYNLKNRIRGNGSGKA